MSDTINNNQTGTATSLEDAYRSLMNLSGQDSIDTLKAAWNYLQVYSAWCEKLPNTETFLNTYLNITDSGSYDFYTGMLEAYQSTSAAATHFINNIFPGVVGIGDDLQNFAQTAGTTEEQGGIFATVTSLLKTITSTTSPEDSQNILQTKVLPLLNALQMMADKNAANAAAVGKELASYKSELIKADGKLDAVDQLVSKDASVSQATIDKLSGGPEVTGSIAQLEKLKDTEQEEYKKDVTIACTTLTYAWVVWPVPPIPIGLIAGATVAGIYGKKATDMLKQINQTSDLIKKDQHELATAIAVHQVQNLAKSGLDSALKYTDQAITQATTMQNNWNTISSNLTDIQAELNKTTFGQGSDEKAQIKPLINVWLNQATNYWKTMVPLVNALVEHPYIAVLSGNKTATEMLEIIEGNKK